MSLLVKVLLVRGYWLDCLVLVRLRTLQGWPLGLLFLGIRVWLSLEQL